MVLQLEDLTIEPKQLPFTERKRRDLFIRHPHTADFILTIERLWEEFSVEFNPDRRKDRLDKLLKVLRFTIHQKAIALEKKWMNKKIPADEFEHEFWMVAWMLCEEKYSPFSPFYFYETFLLAVERKGIDIVRKYTKSKKHAVNTDSLPLLDNSSDWLSSGEDIENHITDKILVEQILNDEVLTDQERRILQVKYENPDFSLRKIADRLEMHVEEVRRALVRVKEKLNDCDYRFY